MSLPENATGWAMFAFFAIGAAGGWFVLVVLSIDIVRGYRKSALLRSKPE